MITLDTEEYLSNTHIWKGTREKYCFLKRKNNGRTEYAKCISSSADFNGVILLLDDSRNIVDKLEYENIKFLMADGWRVIFGHFA